MLRETWQDFKIALQFLTRLPAGRLVADQGSLARAVPFFPVIGAIVGLLGAAAYWLAWWLGLAGFISALVAIAVMVLASGALHEDGLADVADGLGGGRTRARKLEIMRDSTLGAYGAIALMLALLARISALANLGLPETVAPAVLGAAIVSRAAIVPAMRLPPARREGRAVEAGVPARSSVFLALAIAAAASLALLPPIPALIATATALAAGSLLAQFADAKLGGITGDVLGAVQQVAEIGFLFAIAATHG